MFTKVESFRELGIPVQRKVVKVQQQTFYKDTDKGKKSFVAEGRVSEWKDADEPEGSEADLNSLTALPSPD